MLYDVLTAITDLVYTDEQEREHGVERYGNKRSNESNFIIRQKQRRALGSLGRGGCGGESMIKPGLYKVVKVDDYKVHLPQGRMPVVGDIVTLDNHVCNRWHNGSGDWCWAYLGDEYGAHFHESHLAQV